MNRVAALFLLVLCCAILLPDSTSPIRFDLKPIPSRLENGEAAARHVPATMGRGVAVFDYNQNGRPDICFTNCDNLESPKIVSPKFTNRLSRNRGNGTLHDVTDAPVLRGTGFDC